MHHEVERAWGEFDDPDPDPADDEDAGLLHVSEISVAKVAARGEDGGGGLRTMAYRVADPAPSEEAPWYVKYPAPSLLTKWFVNRAAFDVAKALHESARCVFVETGMGTELRELISTEEDAIVALDKSVGRTLERVARKLGGKVPASVANLPFETQREMAKAADMLREKATHMTRRAAHCKALADSTFRLEYHAEIVHDVTVAKRHTEAALKSSSSMHIELPSMRPERKEMEIQTAANMKIGKKNMERAAYYAEARANPGGVSATVDVADEAFGMLKALLRPASRGGMDIGLDAFEGEGDSVPAPSPVRFPVR
jgi:hypothetical protein